MDERDGKETRLVARRLRDNGARQRQLRQCDGTDQRGLLPLAEWALVDRTQRRYTLSGKTRRAVALHGGEGDTVPPVHVRQHAKHREAQIGRQEEQYAD